LLTVIGLSHAEDVTLSATWCVAHDNHSPLQLAEANEPWFTIVFARVFNLDGHAPKDLDRIGKVQTAIGKRSIPLARIVGDAHSN
jgi:hypothetical protein